MTSTISIVFFLLLTITYSIIKYYTDSSMNKILIIIYYLSLLGGEFFINLGLTNTICGSTQFNIALQTLIPWISIYFFIFVLLDWFPNWLYPFSNTIGYFFAYIAGINSFFKSIIKDKDTLKLDATQKDIATIINNVYQDKSLMINSMTTDTDVSSWWKAMKTAGLLKPNVGNYEISELKKYIKMKTTVAEFIWYTLTGVLVTLISHNFIINSGCSQSAEEMIKRHDEFVKQEEEIAKAQQNKKNNEMIYKSYE